MANSYHYNTMILYGAPVKEKIKEELIERIKKLKEKACLPVGRPVLAIVQVGDREDSNVYIRQKQKFGAEIGVEVKLIKIKSASAEALADEVKKLNEDESTNGIIVQLPLPKYIDTGKNNKFGFSPKRCRRINFG